MAGCNKMENPNYMDGGVDRKDEKKQKEKSSFSFDQSGTSVISLQANSKVYEKMLRDTLSSMKRMADLTEQVSIRKQEAVERAIKAADDAKIVAETSRKAADDAEKNTPDFEGGDSLYNKVLRDTLSDMKRMADLTEQASIRKQEAVELAIKAANDAKIAAETSRKAADDAEKNTPDFEGGDSSYNKTLRDTLSSMKSMADLTEQASIRQQEAVERAIKAADDAKIAAEAAPKAVDDAEKTTPEFGGVGPSTSEEMESTFDRSGYQ